MIYLEDDSVEEDMDLLDRFYRWSRLRSRIPEPIGAIIREISKKLTTKTATKIHKAKPALLAAPDNSLTAFAIMKGTTTLVIVML